MKQIAALEHPLARVTARAQRAEATVELQEQVAQVLDVPHAERFVDLAPAQVYASLLDEGTYHRSERTMYRVHAAHAEVRERCAQRRHPVYAAPERLATGPAQLWSWDITTLKRPTVGVCYHLDLVRGVFRRYGVGWMVAPRESVVQAERLTPRAARAKAFLTAAYAARSERFVRRPPTPAPPPIAARIPHTHLVPEAVAPELPSPWCLTIVDRFR